MKFVLLMFAFKFSKSLIFGEAEQHLLRSLVQDINHQNFTCLSIFSWWFKRKTVQVSTNILCPAPLFSCALYYYYIKRFSCLRTLASLLGRQSQYHVKNDLPRSFESVLRDPITYSSHVGCRITTTA